MLIISLVVKHWPTRIYKEPFSVSRGDISSTYGIKFGAVPEVNV